MLSLTGINTHWFNFAASHVELAVVVITMTILPLVMTSTHHRHKVFEVYAHVPAQMDFSAKFTHFRLAHVREGYARGRQLDLVFPYSIIESDWLVRQSTLCPSVTLYYLLRVTLR